MFKWRNLVCLLLIAILPGSVAASDSGAALMHSTSGVYLNGAAAPASSALFRNDFVQTRKGSIAKIDLTGSTLTVQPESVAQFEGDEISLDHGAVLVSSSTGFRVRVGCVIVSPANAAWTDYDVIDVDGKVTVSAHKSDVKIETRITGSQSVKRAESAGVTVREGEQTSRPDQCGPSSRTRLGASGPLLDSSWVKWGGIAAVAVVTCWALCHSDNPISPADPGK